MDNKADFISLAGLRPDGRRGREIRRVRCRFGVFKVNPLFTNHVYILTVLQVLPFPGLSTQRPAGARGILVWRLRRCNIATILPVDDRKVATYLEYSAWPLTTADTLVLIGCARIAAQSINQSSLFISSHSLVLLCLHACPLLRALFCTNIISTQRLGQVVASVEGDASSLCTQNETDITIIHSVVPIDLL